jgi:hypothetical protein
VSIAVRLRGARARALIEGYRRGRWHRLVSVSLRRSAVLRVNVTDRGYAGVRVRAGLAPRGRWVVSRVVRVAPRPRRS